MGTVFALFFLFFLCLFVLAPPSPSLQCEPPRCCVLWVDNQRRVSVTKAAGEMMSASSAERSVRYIFEVVHQTPPNVLAAKVVRNERRHNASLTD